MLGDRSEAIFECLSFSPIWSLEKPFGLRHTPEDLLLFGKLAEF